MLPTELYTAILEKLDYLTLLKCMQVCTLFQSLILRTASLQYIIELAVAKQISGQASGISSSQRLELMKKHRFAWNKLIWSREVKIPMEGGGLWELFGGVLAQSKPDGALVFHQLPSDLRSIDIRTWTLGPDFGMLVRDFAMDPSQDLLVLIESPDWSLPDSALEYRVHLRSLSTGKPHPHAAQSTLHLSQEIRDIFVTYTIQIFQNLLAILFDPSSAGENEIVIWEWKKGVALMDIYSDDIVSFSLLSKDWVLFSVIDIFGSPHMEAINFTEEPCDRHDLQEVQHVYAFEYPELHLGVFCSNIEIRSDPSTAAPIDSTVPFAGDTTDFLLTVSLWLVINGAPRCILHFIPSSHLLSTINLHVQSSIMDSTFVWSDWGPEKTRMLFPNVNPSEIWVCYVSGTNFVISEPVSEGQPGYSVRLYDFNRLALEKDAKASHSDTEAPKGINLSPTVMEKNNPFEDEITTSLPFRTQTLVLEDAHTHCTALCSEDNIIVVDPECREYRILVF